MMTKKTKTDWFSDLVELHKKATFGSSSDRSWLEDYESNHNDEVVSPKSQSLDKPEEE
jgi:hypothetical protein